MFQELPDTASYQPAAFFTAPQREVLTVAGLDLSPHQPADPWPCFRGHDGSWILPGLHGLANAGLPGLAEVLTAFSAELGPWEQWGFLVRRSEDFGGQSPLEYLGQGGSVQAVVNFARQLHISL